MSSVPNTEAVGRNSAPTLLEIIRLKSQESRLKQQLRAQREQQREQLDTQLQLQTNELGAAAERQQTAIAAETEARRDTQFDAFLARGEERDFAREQSAQAMDFARENREDTQTQERELQDAAAKNAMALQDAQIRAQQEADRADREERERNAARELALRATTFMSIASSLSRMANLYDTQAQTDIENQQREVKQSNLAAKQADLKKLSIQDRREVLSRVASLISANNQAREQWAAVSQSAVSGSLLNDPLNFVKEVAPEVGTIARANANAGSVALSASGMGLPTAKLESVPHPDLTIETMSDRVSNRIINGLDSFLREVEPDSHDDIKDALRDVIRASYEATPGIKNTKADIDNATEALRAATERFIRLTGPAGYEVLRSIAKSGESGLRTVMESDRKLRNMSMDDVARIRDPELRAKVLPYLGLGALNVVASSALPPTTAEDLAEIIKNTMGDAEPIDKAILMTNLLDAGYPEPYVKNVMSEIADPLSSYIEHTTRASDYEKQILDLQNEIDRTTTQMNNALRRGDLEGMQSLLSTLASLLSAQANGVFSGPGFDFLQQLGALDDGGFDDADGDTGDDPGSVDTMGRRARNRKSGKTL